LINYRSSTEDYNEGQAKKKRNAGKINRKSKKVQDKREEWNKEERRGEERKRSIGAWMYFDVAGVGYCKKEKKPNFLSNI